MEFFNSAVDVLKTLVVALGAGLGVWGAVNLMEGYGGDNPSAKSQGMKQLMAGGGPDWHHSGTPAVRSVRLIFFGRHLLPLHITCKQLPAPPWQTASYYNKEAHCKPNTHLYFERTVLLCSF